MQRIFSSAAKGTYDAKKSSSGAGELKIYWTKPPAGCRLWVLYGERKSQLGGTDHRERMRSTRWAVLMSFGQRESWQDRSCLPVGRVDKATRRLRLDSFEFMGNDDLQSLADRS